VEEEMGMGQRARTKESLYLQIKRYDNRSETKEKKNGKTRMKEAR
jgi:hypothetical protein